MKNKILIAPIFILLIVAGIFLIFFLIFNNQEPDRFDKVADRKYIEKLRNTPSSEEIIIEDKTIKKDYNPVDKGLKIKENDEVLLDIKLISPYTVTGLIAGSDTKVAEFLLVDWDEKRNNLFEEVNYFNVKDNYKPVSKTFRYRYGVEQENCEEECFSYTTWTDFTTLDELPHKNIKIGAFTKTKRLESVEWIPTIEGFEILQWAGWDLSTAVDNGQNLSISTEETNIHGVTFSTDGTKMYIVGTSRDRVIQFDCSTPWNVTTCSNSNKNVSTSSQDAPRGLWFRSDGKLMLIVGDGGDPIGVNVFTLTSAWDVSTASEISDDCATGDPTGVWVNPSGTLMLVSKASPQNVQMLTLDPAWDFSTCSSAGTFNPGEMTTIDDVAFKRSDGRSMWLLSRTDDTAYKYTLTTDYNVTTASYDSVSYAPGVDSGMSGIAFKSNGGAIYFSGFTNDSVYQYDMEVSMVVLNIPVNETAFIVNQVELNCSATAIGGTISNISLYIDGSKNTSINGTASYEELNITLPFNDGSHNWTCSATDTDNNFAWAVNRTFTVDINPPTVNITYPIIVNYQIINTNLTINWSVSDVSLDSCWGSWDGGTNNDTLTCADNNLTVNITSINNNTFTFYANDTLGHENSSSRTWNYIIFQNDVSFSASTKEGATEKFLLNFTQGGGLQTSTINLVYNSTSHSSQFSISSDNVSSSTSITIPNQDSLLDIPFYWNIIMSNNQEINTTTYTQSVDLLLIDNCSKLTTVIYNYTVYDEETQDKLSNTTIEIQLNLFNSLGINLLNFSDSANNTNPMQVCMNGSLSTSINYSVTSVVKYSANDTENNKSYAIEYYNILNGILSNASIPNDISLYDLRTDDSTEFQLTFRDSSFGLASDVLVYLYRQYIADNDFKVVEVPLTDSSGQTILHMVRNDVVYNIIMVDRDGNILATFNKIIAFCQDFTIGECSLRLTAKGGEEELYNYDEDLGISYSPITYSNATGLVSLQFVSSDLTPKTVRMDIIRESPFGNRSVCTGTLTSATGTVTCNVSSVSATDRFLFIDVSVDGGFIAKETIDLEAEDFNYGTVNGAFFAFLILLFMITMFMEDKQILVLSLGLGWAVVIALGLISGKLVGSLSAGIWLIISIVIFMWKLNEEEGA